MYISEYCKEVPRKEWRHSGILKNNEAQTVAMILARNGIIPPAIWKHDPKLRDIECKRVSDYLIENGLEVADIWK